MCKYYQWESSNLESRNNKSFAYTNKIQHEQLWPDFVQSLKESYWQFIKHQTATLNQHNTRKLLSANRDNGVTPPLLNNTSLFCSIDYISNLCVKSRHNPISSFTNQRQIAFCELFTIIKQNGKLERQSHCYLSGDPKHDWIMSSFIVEKFICDKKQYFTNHLKRELKTCFFYSDRSPKEFSTTPFLQELIAISKKTGVVIVWNFTAPQHGKWLHDAEGSVIKRVYIDGILNEALQFTNSIPFETTIVNYLRSIFNNSKTKIDRAFYEIHNGDIAHRKNNCNTLQGIKSMFCFRTAINDIDNSIYCRPMTCMCSNCANQQWNDCTNVNTCGKWTKRSIKQKKKAVANATQSNQFGNQHSVVYYANRRQQEPNSSNANNLDINMGEPNDNNHQNCTNEHTYTDYSKYSDTVLSRE